MKTFLRHAAVIGMALVLLLCMTAGLSAAEEAAQAAASAAWTAPAEIRKDETGQWDYGILEDGTAVITGFTAGSDRMVFPDEVDGIPVTVVARAPLGSPDYEKIKTVMLPKGLKAVECRAFENCTSLTKVTFPKGLETIGYRAFRGCKKLGGITIPDGVTSIGEEAFSYCGKLSLSALPKGLAEIGNGAFFQCAKLKKITLPAAVRSVGNRAFGFTGVRSLTLNEGLETIGSEAFANHQLRAIVIPESVKRIGNAAFVPLKSKEAKKVTFSSISTEIGIGVFGYDNGWSAYRKKMEAQGTKVTLADYDTQNPDNWIDYYRDFGYFDQGTLTVSCYPGSTADWLYQYHVTKDYLKGSTQNTTVIPADRVLQAGLYTNEDGIYELTVPEGVEEIADSALAGLGTLTKVTLPATLTRIGAHVFEQCISLKEVVFQGKELAEIGEAAFSGCSELKSITIPAGITEIADSTFYQCKNLKSVKLPKQGILRIGDKAFAECAALTDVALNAGLEYIGKEAFCRSGLTGAQIPDSVTYIGTKAFYLSGLTKLRLPAAMEEIPEYLCAFSTKLAQLTLPRSMKRIGKGAFMQCPVGDFKLPEGLESIGEKAFAFDSDIAQQRYGRGKGMSRLRNLNLPASLKTIGSEAFIANDMLSAITFAKNSQLEEIGENAFSYCFRLKNITLPDSLRKIGSEAFLRCVELNRVNLGNGITEIGDKAFEYCLKLRSLTAPESLKTIGKDVVKYCTGKLVVTCPEGSAMQAYMQKDFPNVTLKLTKPKP